MPMSLQVPAFVQLSVAHLLHGRYGAIVFIERGRASGVSLDAMGLDELCYATLKQLAARNEVQREVELLRGGKYSTRLYDLLDEAGWGMQDLPDDSAERFPGELHGLWRQSHLADVHFRLKNWREGFLTPSTVVLMRMTEAEISAEEAGITDQELEFLRNLQHHELALT